MGWSIAYFDHRCKVRLYEEQRKPDPDNALIALLCEAVRLGREYARLEKGGSE